MDKFGKCSIRGSTRISGKLHVSRVGHSLHSHLSVGLRAGQKFKKLHNGLQLEQSNLTWQTRKWCITASMDHLLCAQIYCFLQHIAH